MNFPDALRTEREKAGFTQAALSKKSGISRPFIGLLEQGRRTIEQVDLEKIANALNLIGKDRKAFIESGNLTHGTDALRSLLQQSRAQVRYLSDLIGIGMPITPLPADEKKYGAEAAAKLATLRRVVQALQERVAELEGKKKKQAAYGIDDFITDDVTVAAPVSQRPRGRPKKL